MSLSERDVEGLIDSLVSLTFDTVAIDDLAQVKIEYGDLIQTARD